MWEELTGVWAGLAYMWEWRVGVWEGLSGVWEELAGAHSVYVSCREQQSSGSSCL